MKELNLYDYEMLDEEITAISNFVESCKEVFDNVGYTKDSDYLSLNFISSLLDKKAKKVKEVVEFAFNLYFENKELKEKESYINTDKELENE